ncbi:hypothetical protein HAX54_031070 [Datura stramonium]|uniref:Uncharacterized protein n=1 Tax=Datura stramonium TaxID=4076 RepID=A0ABS8V9U5_DATST|nr:hypothetical protein [Datura stramonium]
MEEYYVAFKEKRSIHDEAQFEVDYLKNSFQDIYDQIGMHDWGPFNIPIDPYFPELVWEFYASHRARQWLLKNKGHTETLPYLQFVWVCGQEADSVITLATQTDKDAPDMKQAKCTKNRNPPSPSASSHTSAVQLYTAAFPTFHTSLFDQSSTTGRST